MHKPFMLALLGGGAGETLFSRDKNNLEIFLSIREG